MLNGFYSDFDVERCLGGASGGDFRTPFQIDRDRVLHTPTFRRLQNKTQVFWSGEYDFYRTRLTHSLEVAQIGKSVCYWLKTRPGGPLGDGFFIDPDLVEAICLSHDLGHPPFGHAGERTLNHLLREAGGFEGNAQTLRILTERIFSAKRTGMNPTRAFLDGVLKYKSMWTELRAATGAASKTVGVALLDGKTGVPPVREDSASRLSADKTTGGKPVGPDRRDACPPARMTALSLAPAASYLPMQKRLKIAPSRSSVSSLPGISPRASRASRRSMAASSGMSAWFVRRSMAASKALRAFSRLA